MARVVETEWAEDRVTHELDETQTEESEMGLYKGLVIKTSCETDWRMTHELDNARTEQIAL